MSSNSVCNHTSDYQIGLTLRGHPILLITHMITDRIGFHSVLYPLQIKNSLALIPLLSSPDTGITIALD